MARHVKGSAHAFGRRYDASGRRRESAQRRDRVLDAARSRFLADGFVATTIPAVAADAGVSVELVYKAFGSKAALAHAVWERALLGQQDRPAETRSDEVSATADDPRVILRNWAALSAEVGELGAPLYAMMRAAAQVDETAAQLFEELERARRRRMTHNAAYLLDGRHVRRGLTAAQVVDVLMHASGELYESFVLRRGWDRDAYVEVTYRFLEGALLP
jgi:AcrR family transcriptional regulator